MSSYLFSFLNFIDLFGYKPIIYVNGEANFKSIYGGIITIIVSISFISIFIIQMYEYINSNIPTEIQGKEQIYNYSISLNRTNYLLAYVIEFPEKKTANFDFNRFIKIDALIHYDKLHPNLYQNYSNIFFTNCTNFNLDKFILSESKKNTLINKAICIDLNNTILKNSEITGKNILEISLNKNITYLKELGIYEDPEFWMQPNEKYSDIWSKFNLSVFYQSLIYSPSKYSINPVQKMINSDNRELDFEFMQDYSFTITTLKSKKQSDLFRKTKYSNGNTYYDSANFKQIEPELHESDIENNDFIRISSYLIYFDNTIEYHILKYTSFLQLISEIGVTMNFILTIFKFIFSFFQQLEEIHYLMDVCFNYSNKDNKDLNNQKISFNIYNKQINDYKFNNNNSSNNIIIHDNIINNSRNINNNLNFLKIEKSPINKSLFVSSKNQILKNSVENKNLIFSSNSVTSLQKNYLTVKPELNLKDISININFKKDSNIEMRVKKKDFYYYLLGSKKKFYIEKFKKYVCFENMIKFNEEWENYKTHFLSKENLYNSSKNNLFLNKERNEINKNIKKDIITQYDLFN